MTDFNIPIPTDDLNAKPVFLMPAGWYGTTLQTGAEIAQNDSGWKGVRIPFAGFTSKKDGKTYERDRRFQITVENPNSDKSVEIGRQQATAVAVAFGLAEDTTTPEGKTAKRMTASSPEELVEQLNSVAGSPCDVYITTKKRKRDGAVVMRDDGQGPVIDNEVSRVAAFGEGK
jgi:hypothetical protein